MKSSSCNHIARNVCLIWLVVIAHGARTYTILTRIGQKYESTVLKAHMYNRRLKRLDSGCSLAKLPSGCTQQDRGKTHRLCVFTHLAYCSFIASSGQADLAILHLKFGVPHPSLHARNALDIPLIDVACTVYLIIAKLHLKTAPLQPLLSNLCPGMLYGTKVQHILHVVLAHVSPI